VNLPAIVSLQDGERWRITLVHLSCQTVHRWLSRSGNNIWLEDESGQGGREAMECPSGRTPDDREGATAGRILPAPAEASRARDAAITGGGHAIARRGSPV
jgi:hypothetical protein